MSPKAAAILFILALSEEHNITMSYIKLFFALCKNYYQRPITVKKRVTGRSLDWRKALKENPYCHFELLRPFIVPARLGQWVFFRDTKANKGKDAFEW